MASDHRYKSPVVMTTDLQNTNRPLALILTLVFHAAIVGLLVLIIMKTPIPPYPEAGGGSGLEVNFGNSQNGMGNHQPEELIEVNTTNISKANNSDDNYLTQNDESVNMKSNPNKAKNNDPIKINDPVINSNALYKKKSGNEGETGKPGDQGDPNGSLYAKNHYGKPGEGGPGSGGKGGGISYNIKDRTAKSLPKPKYNSTEQGKVVVSITVDKKGNVVKAKAGAKGTTADQSLWKVAEEAAYKAKFDVSKDAPEEQKGTITYNFINLN
jgi:hypothetical protein